ncbi:hypothetical protein V8G54_020988 [Vigna mungo]|uniref:Uncharacterized protein n=1 Tax=Vigna mungo TaxID=3915 RepID=A0AAQ3NEZ5_VIGMU
MIRSSNLDGANLSSKARRKASQEWCHVKKNKNLVFLNIQPSASSPLKEGRCIDDGEVIQGVWIPKRKCEQLCHVTCLRNWLRKKNLLKFSVKGRKYVKRVCHERKMVNESTNERLLVWLDIDEVGICCSMTMLILVVRLLQNYSMFLVDVYFVGCSFFFNVVVEVIQVCWWPIHVHLPHVIGGGSKTLISVVMSVEDQGFLVYHPFVIERDTTVKYEGKDDTFVNTEAMEGDRKIISNLEISVKIIQKWIKVFTKVVFVLCMMNIIVPEIEVWRLFDTCAFCRYLPLFPRKATKRSKFEDHRTAQEERRQVKNPVQASESAANPNGDREEHGGTTKHQKDDQKPQETKTSVRSRHYYFGSTLGYFRTETTQGDESPLAHHINAHHILLDNGRFKSQSTWNQNEQVNPSRFMLKAEEVNPSRFLLKAEEVNPSRFMLKAEEVNPSRFMLKAEEVNPSRFLLKAEEVNPSRFMLKAEEVNPSRFMLKAEEAEEVNPSRFVLKAERSKSLSSTRKLKTKTERGKSLSLKKKPRSKSLLSTRKLKTKTEGKSLSLKKKPREVNPSRQPSKRCRIQSGRPAIKALSDPIWTPNYQSVVGSYPDAQPSKRCRILSGRLTIKALTDSIWTPSHKRVVRSYPNAQVLKRCRILSGRPTIKALTDPIRTPNYQSVDGSYPDAQLSKHCWILSGRPTIKALSDPIRTPNHKSIDGSYLDTQP